MNNPPTTQGVTLREAAQTVLKDLDALIAESHGVSGLHLNGDIATWGELTKGGRFEEWLCSLEQLRAALSHPPAPEQPSVEPKPDRAFLERTLAAMEGVLDVADRKTDEFDAMRNCVIDLTLMLHKHSQQLLAAISAQGEPESAELARHQPCGCVVCTCEDEERCNGCGAKNCGTHPVGEIPNPVFATPTASTAAPEAAKPTQENHHG